ncbi:MAG: hypothetical protein R6X10_05965 [Desulfobacterales bacterium]
MTEDYSIEICRKLEKKFLDTKLHRPMRVERYDAGSELEYEVHEVGGTGNGKVKLAIDQFIGGGFAGQVYRVKILDIDAGHHSIGQLEIGGTYAMKILIPPSGFSLIFRNALYWAGFQGPFQLQVNPHAAKAGAIWQKFIRRGARIRFGDENSVVDIHATFIDTTLGSCGELSEWVDGRTWRLEVDDRLDLLKLWKKKKLPETVQPGSPEYRAKYEFMHSFVELLHDMGGHEFARQYEWSTCKSQPNCLKRIKTEDTPQSGLVAVDFRAGLALLPFLPMSPGDFKLILKGIGRGSLVQFDRGSIKKLEHFINTYPDEFADMRGMLEELKESETIYRNSVPDITHNHFRLFYSRQLWSTMFSSAVTGWKVRNIIDEPASKTIGQSRFLIFLFFLIGLLPLLGGFLRKIFGREDLRRHYLEFITSCRYCKRTFRAKIFEKLIPWHRAGRIDEINTLRTAESNWRFLYQLPFSVLPAGLHRILTDWGYAKERVDYYLFRPVRLYFNTELREEWLRDMVSDGRKKYILTDEDAEIILSKIKEPFIQKYMKSLAVHVCTMPVTQVVSVIVAVIYVAMHPEMPKAQAWGIGVGIIALFQVVPISPGSLVRGLYVVYLVVRERNFRDYNIAVFLGFFKYIGYLAFPIQMAYRYPELARFMAGHWAKESVHIVPVFGESGALLEHWVYCLFYNWPLTIRRRIQKRIEMRSHLKTRYWHILLCAIATAGIFGYTDFWFFNKNGVTPNLKEIWWIVIILPLACGSMVTYGFGGAGLFKRFAGSALSGVLTGLFYTLITATLFNVPGDEPGGLVAVGIWRIFLFSILSTIGAIITELKMVDPAIRKNVIP